MTKQWTKHVYTKSVYKWYWMCVCVFCLCCLSPSPSTSLRLSNIHWCRFIVMRLSFSFYHFFFLWLELLNSEGDAKGPSKRIESCALLPAQQVDHFAWQKKKSCHFILCISVVYAPLEQINFHCLDWFAVRTSHSSRTTMSSQFSLLFVFFAYKSRRRRRRKT